MQRLLYILPWLLSLAANSQVKMDFCQAEGKSLQRNDRAIIFLHTAYAFIFLHPHADSAMHYIGLAKQQAQGKNDNCLLAAANLMEADVEGRLKGNPERMELLADVALALLGKETNPKIFAAAKRTLALSHILQGKDHAALKNLNEALKVSSSVNDKAGIGWAYYLRGFYYGKKGHLWQSFENLVKSRAIGIEIKDDFMEAVSIFFIARAYNNSGDPRKAIEYYHQGFAINKTPFLLLWPHLEDLGFAYLKLNKFDSAIYYQQKHRNNIINLSADINIRQRFSNWTLPDFRLEGRLEQKQFSSVLKTVLPSLPSIRKNKDKMLLLHSLFLAARSYAGLKQPSKARELNSELISMARSSLNRNFLEKAYLLQANIFRDLNLTDSSWYYLQEHLALKQAVSNEQFNVRAAMYHATAEIDKKIAIWNKDKLIQQQQLAIKERELEKKNQFQRMLIALIIGIILLTITVIINIFLRRKNEQLENEQKQAALQQKSLELEMQALRAQMNPHFIFNCLSAIDTLIHTGNADKATVYLSRFARLIRLVMDSLKNNLVPFQKDLETMQLYLELEQFRCNHKFSYSLQADPDLVEGDFKVPPLIAQPFIENAIHHGLLNKNTNNRKLEIVASLIKGQIVYSITDNGIGRRKAAVLKELNRPEHQSYGIDITRERVSLHNRTGLKTDVTITDLEEDDGRPLGTKAVVRINSEFV